MISLFLIMRRALLGASTMSYSVYPSSWPRFTDAISIYWIFPLYLETDKVSVNWEVKNHISIGLSEGDLISVRGYGRFKLEKINGLSRKGRMHVVILKYI